MAKARIEQYQDMIGRLFPQDIPGEGSLVKTLTFQVTDDCNLACTYCYQINKGKRVKFKRKVLEISLIEERGKNGTI